MNEYLKSFQILSDDEINLFESKLVKKRLKKGDLFIQEGQTSKEIAFVFSGLLRSYYHTASAEEVTYCFSFANEFTGAYTSFLSQRKTVLNVQALTDSVLLSISREDVLALEKSSYNWLKLFKVIAEQEFVQTEKRIFLLQKETAQIRYLNLQANHPEFLQLIPLNYLASYLGITQRHLSRIRRTVTN
ncbi:cyclic nucleotide-binding domain-containing protein [Muricauda sp. JGD-17]|uniref:Cyclic nucleotide-binding domain-containing protein n=1 Tax=Flagellimonas ochracea TaxID=2696472 RepID=A0A964TCN0_9FLAO|nr:cyclic nucleotide-binding domain-containing protein [Allomuricauda ochracea]